MAHEVGPVTRFPFPIYNLFPVQSLGEDMNDESGMNTNKKKKKKKKKNLAKKKGVGLALSHTIPRDGESEEGWGVRERCKCTACTIQMSQLLWGNSGTLARLRIQPISP